MKKLNKKSIFQVIAVILSIPLVLAGCGGDKTETHAKNESAFGKGMNLTVVGGTAGGFWSLVGEGVGNIIREDIPNTQYSYEPGNGVANTVTVANGKVPMGLAHNFEIRAALTGSEPFKEKVSDVKAIATIYNNAPLQVIMSRSFADKYGITSFEDIAAKKPPIKIAVDQRGNLSEMLNRLTLESYGITYSDIKKWGGKVYFEGYKAAADMMKDNKVDLWGDPIFAPDGKVLELADAKEIMILTLNQKAKKLLNEKMGVPGGTIPDKTYKWQTEEVATVNGSAILMADPKMSVDDAYLITKTLVENIDKIKSMHKNLQILTPEIMTDVSPATLHPGAEKYYKEKGIIK
ncbi:TAXI family TRAP transporter solute-binding subunit [Fictibacillus enclensis]|uniref:TAXI family TRAP transporter solute-binding subunit n=1 Tax=Fictibacillus enclensis TaxID=1017270 RepID=UPI0025A0C585|nr:TAXI family TRAP transporter solute-binding subunit [Fictibacillus enclensis]MDM5196709.1 TAXI family TRAP transporter solute-binding subunit [Fictibacillus enclensis]